MKNEQFTMNNSYSRQELEGSRERLSFSLLLHRDRPSLDMFNPGSRPWPGKALRPALALDCLPGVLGQSGPVVEVILSRPKVVAVGAGAGIQGVLRGPAIGRARLGPVAHPPPPPAPPP